MLQVYCLSSILGAQRVKIDGPGDSLRRLHGVLGRVDALARDYPLLDGELHQVFARLDDLRLLILAFIERDGLHFDDVV